MREKRDVLNRRWLVGLCRKIIQAGAPKAHTRRCCFGMHKSLTLSSGRSSLVVKVSDCGWLVTSSSPVPLKTRHGDEWGKIIGLREGGFSYRAIGARVQWNSSTVMRVWKLWTDEHRTTLKTGSKRWKVMSACDDRHLLQMTVNDRTASSR
ncbi:uncharacterized protein TNCV_39031 [Trichonephila clavipes]|nr:uncharacterized protein TNCV_39031 [Trichonephila clavipes]